MKKSADSKSRVFTGFSFLFAFLLILSSCNKSTYGSMMGTTNNPAGNGGTPGANEVFIQGMAFSPSSITIAAGTTITWTNKDGYAHTVTSDSNLFDSGNLASNGTFAFTFMTPGTYKYHCKIHSSMTATVIVN